MKRLNVEFAVGLFLLAGLGSLFYLAVKLGDVGVLDDGTYTLQARFSSTSGLKQGAYVEVAGVRVGKVTRIELDPQQYQSVVYLSLPRTVRIQEDSIASIRTSGILGDRYVKLTPGGADEYLEDGGQIIDTEASINIEELISKYMFESDKKKP